MSDEPTPPQRELRDLATEVVMLRGIVRPSNPNHVVSLGYIVQSWFTSITDLRRLLINAGMRQINLHPINTVWISIVADLNGVIAAPPELVSEALDEVKKISEM